MPVFDFRRFLADHFRTPASLQALVAAYGYAAPKLSTVRKWWSRGSIPADAFPVLLVIAELEAGETVDLMRYTQRRE